MYRKILGNNTGNIEELHKKICISSFLFCDFALIYRLGIFFIQKGWGFLIVNIAGKEQGENPAICTKLYNPKEWRTL